LTGLATLPREHPARIWLVTPPIRLLAVDIDGTLVNSQFRISPRDIDALRQAHASGTEV